MKVLVGAFNQEKALVEGAFSMIVKTDGSFAAVQKMAKLRDEGG